tara:strand:+ start:196 stop:612 length:417 start_codon:yes stop_codon:yes gene_type:complete
MPHRVQITPETEKNIADLKVSNYVKNLIRARCSRRVSLDAAIAQSVAIESSKERLLGLITTAPIIIQDLRRLLNRKSLEEYRQIYNDALEKLEIDAPERIVWNKWWNHAVDIDNRIIGVISQKNPQAILRKEFLPKEW